MIEEVWKTVPSAPWLEASSLGRVRRIKKGARKAHVGTIIIGYVNEDGYRVTTTSHHGARLHNVGFHVLVCEAFRGPRPSPDHEAAHWDGVPDHNWETNLRWATPKENAADRKRHGKDHRGNQHGSAKLSTDEVFQIRRLRSAGFRGSDLAELIDVNRNHANRIAAFRAWPDPVEGVTSAMLCFGC